MQGARAPQPSRTNRPSSYLSCLILDRSDEERRLRKVALCGPQGTALEAENALRRSAAMAGEAHPVPSRTRKLSPRAPMVLRGQPVGEQDAADQRRAFPDAGRQGPARNPRGPLLASGAPGGARLCGVRGDAGFWPRGGGPWAYSYSLRGGAARRTLKTGYCDR